MKSLLLYLILAVLVGHANSSRFYAVVEKPQKYCTFEGYVPGGNKITVAKIIAPVAKMQKNVFSGLAGNLGKASVGAQHSTMLLKGFGKLANIAPKLGPALGLFGVGFSLVKSFIEPSPQDILDQANKAIADLTNEVNSRLDEMKGYVEEKTLELEKDLVNREYKSLFKLWANCVKEVTKEKVNECMEDAAKQIMASRPKFAIFGDDVQADHQPSISDVKRIEANLITFRDYVIMSLASLSTLVATFKDDPAKKREYIRYANDLNTEIKWCVDYARNAVFIIKKMHADFRHCDATKNCTDFTKYYEGWPSVNTMSWLVCSCVIDPADVSTRACRVKIAMRIDGRRTYTRYDLPTADYFSAAKMLGRREVQKQVGKYITDMLATINNYWQNELLDLIPDWENLEVALSKDEISSRDEIEQRRKIVRYSEDFNRRLDQVNDEMAQELDAVYAETFEHRDEIPQDEQTRSFETSFYNDPIPSKRRSFNDFAPRRFAMPSRDFVPRRSMYNYATKGHLLKDFYQQRTQNFRNAQDERRYRNSPRK